MGLNAARYSTDRTSAIYWEKWSGTVPVLADPTRTVLRTIVQQYGTIRAYDLHGFRPLLGILQIRDITA